MSTRMPSSSPMTGTITVGLVRLTSNEGGLEPNLQTGLAAQGILLIEPSPGAEEPLNAIVADTGAHERAAAEWLHKNQLKVPVIVCLDGVTTDKMNTLIAAGAKDIVPYPVTSDVLAKKLRRATRIRSH